MVAANVSRKRKADPLPGIVTHDAPGPLEHFWKHRLDSQRVIPPDELTVRKGLHVFDQMETIDETVAYALRVKKMVRLSTGYSIEPPKDDDGNPLPGSQVIADHVTEQIEKWDRFEQFLYQMLGMLKQGFKLAEIVTDQGRIDGKQSWVVRDCLVRNSRFFTYDVNRAGEATAVVEYVGPGQPDAGGISPTWAPENVNTHSLEKFVRCTWEPEDSNAYGLFGRSDFRPIYRLYFVKDVMIKRWAETLDLYVHPIIIALTREGLTETQRQGLLDEMVTSMKKKGLVVPGELFQQGVDFDKILRFHEVAGKAGDFENFVELCDKSIMRGQFLGALVADTGKSGGGSLALGKAHMGLFLKIMDWLGRSLGSDLKCTLFKQIVRWNFGEQAVDLTPKLVLKAVGDDQAAERGKMVSELVNAGIVDPAEKWVRQYIGLEDAPEELITLREAEMANRTKIEKEGPVYPPGHPKAPQPVVAPGKPPPGKAKGLAADDEQRARIESKVDVEGIREGSRDREERHGLALNEAWRAVFRGKGGLAGQAGRSLRQPAGAVNLSIKTKAVESAWWALFVEAFVAGTADGFLEVRRGRHRLGAEAIPSVRMLKGDDATLDLASFAKKQGVDLDTELAALAAKVELRQADLDLFAEMRKAEIRQAVTQQVEKLRTRMDAALIAAKAQSKGARDFIGNEFSDLERKYTGLQGQMGNENSALWETAENSVYNEGRFRLYEAAPQTAVIGMMYSSVIDGRTTRFCIDWDGYAAPMDEPTWKVVLPPNHWRCRAIVIAVIAGEMTESEIMLAAMRRPSTRPHEGFRGMKFVPPGVGR